MKSIPFILLLVGTLGLLLFEFIDVSRSITLILAGLNVLGLIILALGRSGFCCCKKNK